MKSLSQSGAGDLLMLRLVGAHWSSSLERQLRTLAPRAILLAGPLPRSPEALCELLAGISWCLPVTPILAVEEEGGDHDPLSVFLPPLPSPEPIGQKGPRAARLAGELIGEALKLLGFNTNLAPVLDVAPVFNFAPDPHALTLDREESPNLHAFGADPRAVAECALNWVLGHERHRILSCAKHFPGLAGAVPSLAELPASQRSMAALWARDLIPYRELLPRLPLVMMSTAVYRAYDFDYPRSAVLSRQIVEGLLRLKLRYQGVVVAPGLETERVRGVLDLGRAAAEAVNAGCDLLLVEEEASWQAMRHGLEQTLDSGDLPRDRFDRAACRIQAARQRLSPPSGRLARRAWDRLARRFESFDKELNAA